MAMQASAAVVGPVGAAPRPGEAPAATGPARTSADGRGESPAIKAEWDAERAVTALYGTHYRPLVRLAAMLVGDVPTAEELVQDSFIALHTSWRRPADSDRALSYLRRSVVNRCRSVLWHRLIADKLTPAIAPGIPGAAHEQITLSGHSALVSALRILPPPARGPGASVLRQPVRRPDRHHHGHQHSRGEQPHSPGNVIAASRTAPGQRITAPADTTVFTPVTRASARHRQLCAPATPTPERPYLRALAEEHQKIHGRAEPAQPSRHSRQLRAFREHDSPHKCSGHARYRAWMLTMAGEVLAPGDPGQSGPDLVVDVAELVWEPIAA